MAKKIKGYVFVERYRDSDSVYDECKATRCYLLKYSKENVKILSMVNQFGQGYRDIYIKLEGLMMKIKNGFDGRKMDKIRGIIKWVIRRGGLADEWVKENIVDKAMNDIRRVLLEMLPSDLHKKGEKHEKL